MRSMEAFRPHLGLLRTTPGMVAAVVLALAAASPRLIAAQEQVTVSGLTYLDVEYVADAADSLKGDHGFLYRRIYMTASYHLSDRYSGRFRIASDEESDEKLYIRDMYLEVADLFGGGHRLTAGVASPPGHRPERATWGFRELAVPFLVRGGVRGGRDLGVKLMGPITAGGGLRYGVMVGNGSPGPDYDDGKRGYGLVEWDPTDRVAAVASATLAEAAEGGAAYALQLGYNTGRVRFGAAGFYRPDPARAGRNPLPDRGASLYGVFTIAPSWELAAHADRIEHPDATDYDACVVLGLVRHVRDGIRLLPNLVWDDRAGEPARLLARVTLFAAF
ncbi:MAG: hypothetical protein R6U63_07800 [Longimicrobiales bacterium]